MWHANEERLRYQLSLVLASAMWGPKRYRQVEDALVLTLMGQYMYFVDMARKPGKRPTSVSERKTPKTYRLAAAKIARARAILGASSDTAAIEMALDLVSFRSELVDGTRAMRGVRIERFEAAR
jgi:hypothetical protein